MEHTQDLIREHKRLVQILLHGSDAERKNEALIQMKELKGYMAGKETQGKSKNLSTKELLAIKGLV